MIRKTATFVAALLAASVLTGCGSNPATPPPQPTPARTATTGPPLTRPATPTPTPAPTTTPAPESVYYANCAEVRAAGAAPLHRGDPGYRTGLDRDGDGMACES